MRNNVAGNRDVPKFDIPPITIGAFVISPSARLTTEAESNTFKTDLFRRTDQFAILAARINVSADIQRLALRGFLDGRITRYRRFSQNDADEYAMQVAPLYRIDDANSVSFALSDRRVAEQRGGVSLSLLGFDREIYREPKVELSGTLAGGGLRLNASLAHAKRRYLPLRLPDPARSNDGFGSDPAIAPLREQLAALLGEASGTEIDQSFRNTKATTVSTSLGYDRNAVLNPYLSVIGSRIRSTNPTDCCFRDSTGVSIFGGVRSTAIGLLGLDLAAGYRSRRFKNPAFADFEGLTYNADVQWYPRRYLTVRYRLFQDERNSGIATVAGVRVNGGNATLIYELRRRTVVFLERLAERERFKEIGLTTRLRAYALRATHILGKGLTLDSELSYRARKGNIGDIAINPATAALLNYRNIAFSFGVLRRW